jgi:hypothetical protein
MSTKLTLSLNSKVIERAKRYSEKKGMSLSKIIEEYLLKLTATQVNKNKRSIDELMVGKAPVDTDYKKVVRDYVYEKHVKPIKR